jgi:ubiquinone/menaquinone biosynthesis C-methylase UbiE
MKGADFGCGTGYFTILLAQEVGPSGKIYAIDVDDEALRAAQEFADQTKVRNIKFLHQDLEINSGIMNNSVDFVFISQVLYQSDEPQKIISEAKRVLKDEGYLIVLEAQQENPLFTGQRIHNLQDIANLMEQEGFKIIEINQTSGYYLVVGQK